jgi:predicted transcriptional regulator
MKTIITALVVMATTISASANHSHNAACPVNCPEKVLALMPAGKSFDQKMAELTLANEEKVSQLNFSRIMKSALNKVESEKHFNAIENLEAENGFNVLMAATLEKVEQEKLADQLEDISAEQRFEQLMSKVIVSIAAH